MFNPSVIWLKHLFRNPLFHSGLFELMEGLEHMKMVKPPFLYMLEWMPEETQQQFGSVETSAPGSPCLEFMLEK
jgi:hypothetical protein